MRLNIRRVERALAGTPRRRLRCSESGCGHVKGAFTGAHAPTLGLIRSANGGTLFLDLVGDLSAAILGIGEATLYRKIKKYKIDF